MIRLLIILFLLLETSTSCSQTPSSKVEHKISETVYDSLLFEIKTLGIQNEIIKIETDKFGFITSIKSNQNKLKKLLKGPLLVPYVDANNKLISTSTILTITDKYIKGLKVIDIKEDTIAGQLFTAARLAFYMGEKEYDKAINLFAQSRIKEIEKIKAESKELFDYWIHMWNIKQNGSFASYAEKIIFKQAYFKIEDNEWKINEK